jgi:hypothetical protein
MMFPVISSTCGMPGVRKSVKLLLLIRYVGGDTFGRNGAVSVTNTVFGEPQKDFTQN